MIFVALNYRLGALGFLAGSEVSQDGDLNVGLLDQRLALQWISKYISRFGGAPDKITIMGESAGGGSVIHHWTAYGGDNGPALFSQVIAQSPVVYPVNSNKTEEVFNNFLNNLTVSTLTDARNVSAHDLISANARFIQAAPPTSFLFGPQVDRKFIPRPTAELLGKGKFYKSVTIMAAHNAFEGSFFFDPNVKTDSDFRDWVETVSPGLSKTSMNELLNDIYPPLFDGSLGYTDMDTRQTTL